MPVKGKGCLLNRQQVADTFGVTAKTVGAWIKEGCPTVSEGKSGKAWKLNSAEVHTWLVGRATKDDGKKPATLEQTRQRKLAAEAELAEIELRRARAELVPLDEVIAVARSEYSLIRTRICSLPGKVAPKIDPARAAEIQNTINDEVDEILAELTADDTIGDAYHFPDAGEVSPTEAGDAETEPASRSD